MQRAIYSRCQKTPLDITCNYIRWDEKKCEHVMDRTRWRVERQALMRVFCSFYKFREYFSHFLDIGGILVIFMFLGVLVILLVSNVFRSSFRLCLVIIFVFYFQKLVLENIKKKQFSSLFEIKNMFG